MDDVSVRLEHVDLLNGLDRLNIQLLERSLQLLVINSSGFVCLLDLSSWCALSAIDRLISKFPLSVPVSYSSFPIPVAFDFDVYRESNIPCDTC